MRTELIFLSLSLSLCFPLSLSLFCFYKDHDCFAVTLRCSEEASWRKRKVGGFSEREEDRGTQAS